MLKLLSYLFLLFAKRTSIKCVFILIENILNFH